MYHTWKIADLCKIELQSNSELAPDTPKGTVWERTISEYVNESFLKKRLRKLCLDYGALLDSSAGEEDRVQASLG